MWLKPRTVEEYEYAALYDDGYYWIVEDKTLVGKEIVHTGETKTLVNMRIDFTLIGNQLHGVRYYLPKDQFPISEAKDLLIKINTQRKREHIEYRERFG